MLSRLQIVDGRKLSGSGIHFKPENECVCPIHAPRGEIGCNQQQVTQPTPACSSLPDTPPPAYYVPESPFALKLRLFAYRSSHRLTPRRVHRE